jgi:hypothetical protein
MVKRTNPMIKYFMDLDKLVRLCSDDWRVIRVLNGNYPYQLKKWRWAR